MPTTRQQRRAAARATTKRTKVGPRLYARKVLLDRMPSVVDGEVMYLHEGEWLTVRPMVTQRHTRITLELMAHDLGPGFDMRKITEAEDPEERQSAVNEFLGSRLALSRLLCELVLDWNLTDPITGEPLPKPAGDPNAFDTLGHEEINYISYAVMRAVQVGRGEVYDPEAVPLDGKEQKQ